MQLASMGLCHHTPCFRYSDPLSLALRKCLDASFFEMNEGKNIIIMYIYVPGIVQCVIDLNTQLVGCNL